MTDPVPLVLIPGLLCDRRLFERQIAGLAGLATVTVPDVTGPDSIGGMAERVLADAPPRFALGGLSMGGYVSLEIMRRAPERVMRLALISTNAHADSEEAQAGRRALLARAGEGDFAGAVETLLPRLLGPESLDDPARTALVRSMAEAVGAEGFARQQQAIMGRPDSRPGLGAITCPTLVLCGREDVLTPPAAHREMAEAIPEATLVVVPRCGHLSTLEQAGALTAQLRFWLAAGD
jgi:pimeloyl-ACP methyl ester carboxylesterase